MTDNTDYCSACETVTIWEGEHCTKCCREWGSDSVPGLQNNGVVWRHKTT